MDSNKKIDWDKFNKKSIIRGLITVNPNDDIFLMLFDLPEKAQMLIVNKLPEFDRQWFLRYKKLMNGQWKEVEKADEEDRLL